MTRPRNTQNVFCVQLSASFEDGELGAVDLDMAVVHTQGIESREAVLDGPDMFRSIGEDGATLSFGHILCQHLDEGLPLHIDALYLISVVLRCRTEFHDEVEPRMKSLTRESKTIFYRSLLLTERRYSRLQPRLWG